MSDPVMPVGKYCAALQTWMRIATKTPRGGGTWREGQSTPIISSGDLNTLLLGIRKSCLLKRMIYMGEELRTRRCPIHDGKWSGCYADACPAGCDTCGCACGWLPNDAPAFEAFGWTFWLAHALDDNHRLPGKAPGSAYRPRE